MSGAVTKTNPVATAEAHWGADMPDWIRALAEACAETSQNKVATRIGRSAGPRQPCPSQELSGRYGFR